MADQLVVLMDKKLADPTEKIAVAYLVDLKAECSVE